METDRFGIRAHMIFDPGDVLWRDIGAAHLPRALVLARQFRESWNIESLGNHFKALAKPVEGDQQIGRDFPVCRCEFAQAIGKACTTADNAFSNPAMARAALGFAVHEVNSNHMTMRKYATDGNIPAQPSYALYMLRT